MPDQVLDTESGANEADSAEAADVTDQMIDAAAPGTQPPTDTGRPLTRAR